MQGQTNSQQNPTGTGQPYYAGPNQFTAKPNQDRPAIVCRVKPVHSKTQPGQDSHSMQGQTSSQQNPTRTDKNKMTLYATTLKTFRPAASANVKYEIKTFRHGVVILTAECSTVACSLPHSASLWPAVFHTVLHCDLQPSTQCSTRPAVFHTFYCGLQSSTQYSTVACSLPHSAPLWPLSSTQCSTVACCLPHSAPLWPAVFHTVLHCGLLSSTQCSTVACGLPHSVPLWTGMACSIQSADSLRVGHLLKLSLKHPSFAPPCPNICLSLCMSAFVESYLRAVG